MSPVGPGAPTFGDLLEPTRLLEVLDMTPAQSPWKVGKTGEPNKWVTFYCLLAPKYAGREA